MIAKAAKCAFVLMLCGLASGCSINKIAVNKIGDALASGGGGSFASDDDPELVKSAIPFSLKLMETLLAESPHHRGLLLATASGFTQYAYAFVQEDADELEATDLAAATALRNRARRLYLRAHGYGMRGLEINHAGFEKGLRTNAAQALQACKAADVPLLYWTATSWAAAISLSKDNPDVIADLPLAGAMMQHALVLDEKFGDGAIHSFLITYQMSRPDSTADPEAIARKHFQRAMELAGGQQAGPLVSLAEAVSVPKQDKTEFQKLLNQALAINPDTKPEWRLSNLVMQRRARWLLSRTEDLILEPLPKESSPDNSTNRKP